MASVTDGSDPPGKMTRQAYDLISQGFGPGLNGPLLIVAKLPDPAAATKLDALVNATRRDADVALVTVPRVNRGGNAAISPSRSAARSAATWPAPP